ncbi:hypothetical protein BH11ARM1_BH11ARM1_13100 [soil metagenome]
MSNMRKLTLLPCIAALALGASFASAQKATQAPDPTAPRTATEIIKGAQSQARIDKKNVMVIFHASWCGWCKKLDAYMATPVMKELLDKNYVIVHLDVLEDDAHKNLENPEGMDYMTRFNGKNSGLPFTAIMTADGRMVANSNAEKDGTTGNIGYPAAKGEIDWYIKMLKKTAPYMTTTQLTSIRAWLTKNAPATH